MDNGLVSQKLQPRRSGERKDGTNGRPSQPLWEELSFQYLPTGNRKAWVKISIINILPSLPEGDTQNPLIQHEKVLHIFEYYTFALVSQRGIKSKDILPMSGRQHCIYDDDPTHMEMYLPNTAIPVTIHSLFVASSGHDGKSFKSVTELCSTARNGLNLNGYALPSMSTFVTNEDSPLKHRLNMYILIFYIHGPVSTLARAYCVRQGGI